MQNFVKNELCLVWYFVTGRRLKHPYRMAEIKFSVNTSLRACLRCSPGVFLTGLGMRADIEEGSAGGGGGGGTEVYNKYDHINKTEKDLGNGH